jgi:hypothetical protein
MSNTAGVSTLFHYACNIRDTYTRHRAEVIFLNDATCTYKYTRGANYYLYHMGYIQANVTDT